MATLIRDKALSGCTSSEAGFKIAVGPIVAAAPRAPSLELPSPNNGAPCSCARPCNGCNGGAGPRPCGSFKGLSRARTHGDHDDPCNAFPMPRFPPAHESAAFDAMAVRKSLILTPAEIYMECAHHGDQAQPGARAGSMGRGWLQLHPA
jgi:hypothetical protein